MKIRLIAYMVCVLLLLPCFVKSQDRDSTLIRLKTMLGTLKKNESLVANEHIYIHTDKSYYAQSDTLWLKAYVLTDYLSATEKSGIAYLEFVNDTNIVVKRLMLRLYAGVAQAAVPLNNVEFADGNYTLRCYTNWMRNFGDNQFFSRTFYVGNTDKDGWFVNTSAEAGKEQLKIALQFKKPNEEAVSYQDLRIKVYNGKKQLFSEKMMTRLDGTLDMNIPVPQNTNEVNVRAETLKGNLRRITVPVRFGTDEVADLQFMPEGGMLVAGLRTRIGFKALNAEGLGVAVNGTIADSKKNILASLVSTYKGMGSFTLNPTADENYTATITMPDGTQKSYALPKVQKSGTSLSIANPLSDSINVKISCSPELSGDYMLIARSRGQVYYAAKLSLNGNAMVKPIAKALFPTGIVEFTLLNGKGTPLNSRLAFIDHHDDLQFTLDYGSAIYHPGDSVSMVLQVKDKDGKPVRGTFSMAVTADATVKTDYKANENIWTQLLIAGGVKGNIEEPGCYRQTSDPQMRNALDLLLLTQGWSSFNWGQALNPAYKPLYQPEADFTIAGRVTNMFNKPVAKSPVMLFTNKPPLIRDTLTNDQGRFYFKSLPSSDTLAYHIQARNKKGKSFNVGIAMEEFKAPDVSLNPVRRLPWYVNTDNTLLRFVQNSNKQQQVVKDHIPEGANVLKEVKVKATKIIKGSRSLYQPGRARYTFDQKDMEKAGKKTLYDLFVERIPGFMDGIVPKTNFRWFLIYNSPTMVVVDGVSLNAIYQPLLFEDYRNWLQSQTAEDVLGIEVFLNAAEYEVTYLHSLLPSNQIPFIEITTRAGKGPIIPFTVGTYLYKPMPFAQVKQFYKPRYAVKNPALLATDLRSTIHWEPNIITDNNGKAKVSFYAAGTPDKYTVIVEGADLQGNIGYAEGKVLIASPPK